MIAAATASFRFYGELNDFLAPNRRRREITLRCAERATAKHMVEALGVPHTEVGRIDVNGVPAGLDHLLEDGDIVAVHPVAVHDGSAQAAPRHESARTPWFVADAHLGGLARYLRMAGFDTLYSNELTDDTVEALALDENRTILTRDRELLKRRTITQGCYVRATKPEEQFREVVARLDLSPLAKPFTLCLHCNAPLRAVPKAEVADRLPDAVRATHDAFSQCDRCGRIYWKGSHYQRMSALIARAIGAHAVGAPLA